MKRLDTLAHLLLFLGVVVAVVAFFTLRYDRAAQLWVILTLVAFYILWALVYHYTKRDINKKLFLEYLLVGAICAVVGILVFYL